MERHFTFSLPVTAAVSAILHVYLSTIFVFINRWFGFLSSPGIMNFVAFTAISAMCIFNYVICIFTDPGLVPATYMPDIEICSPVHKVKRKGGNLRFCQKCSHFKPPRAHHCRVCKRCVLRMDHHCIWMNNCVGHANYKPFLLFVVYAVIACLYSLVLLIGSLTNDPLKEEQQSLYSLRTIYAISALLLAPSTVALCILMGWHAYLLLQNKTTIEYHEGVQSMWLAQKEGLVYKHPYNIGVYENLSLVLGPVICCWIFPTFGHISDGLRFPTTYDANVPVADSDISDTGIL